MRRKHSPTFQTRELNRLINSKAESANTVGSGAFSLENKRNATRMECDKVAKSVGSLQATS